MTTTGRTFAYCRVSTADQTTENQTHAIKSAGYNLRANRVMSETISGSVPAMERPGFLSLLNKMEEGDTLVVLKLDRLGRDSIDIQTTIQQLDGAGIRVVSLDLGNTDLTSGAGKLLMQVIAAVAEMERDRIRERTREGLARAKSEGVKLGRPVADDVTAQVLSYRRQGYSQSATAAALGISVRTVKRHCAKLEGDA
ncbi:Site-specific recombinase, DNA invertase [Pseudomonas fluorescens R124]|uniref:Site-specific recombinase, DNA invertase n=1 Tax=Pseudomonas fluorescens R124 TaxID=743713 RepID=A0A7U9CN22_PSEFL|nr:recombinase family protein [Pseudomonas fluorescens]EJZ56404.1 Site-specific recombinase, DNA invertase [Pseudomonas fluorescens R124]